MNEERKNLLIEKCKNEIRRYSDLVKIFDPNKGEEMEQYEENIQDWNDVISVNTLALAALTEQLVNLPNHVDDLHGVGPVMSADEVIAAIRAAGYEVQE